MSWLPLLGWAGNACFFSRFLVQWWLSERAKESVAPRVFWWLSLAGSLTLGTYAFARGELPLVPGYVITLAIYVRNLWITSRGPQSGRIGVVPSLLLGIAAATLLIVTGAIPESDDPFETPWLVVGFVGQAIWSSRFVVQWWMSERAGHSHFPRAFWWLSLAGNVLLLAYAIHRGDPVFVAGYLIGPLVQIRNLMLGRGGGRPAGAGATEPTSRESAV